MGDKLNFLLTFTYQHVDYPPVLLQVALQTKRWDGFDAEHLEENRAHLLKLLPSHVTDGMGPIVKVERLFDIVVLG